MSQAKKPKPGVTIPLAIAELVLEKEKKPFLIREAKIKDDFCNYTYEINRGIGAGDKHKVDGSGIVMDDMKDAFSAFNVHLAVIDDVYKHSGIEIGDIDRFHNDSLALLYHVTGFKIVGGEEIDSIILLGSKYISGGGRIELVTPKIPLDNLSSYKWYNELLAAAEKACDEVEQYKDGKYIIPEKETVEVGVGKKGKKSKQLTIGDQLDGNDEDSDAEDEDENTEDFDNAKV